MKAMGTTTTPMTFEEFERLPDEECKMELLDGEVIRVPPAFTQHMRIVLRLYKTLEGALNPLNREVKGRGLGEIFMETGYHTGRNWLVPDVSIAHPAQQESKYLEGAPVLAVEVMSESNTATMMQRKVRRYMEGGAQEVWLVYPDTQSVVVHRGKTATEVEGTLRSELLPELTIDLAQVFAPGPNA